jgi:hypothetical protein
MTTIPPYDDWRWEPMWRETPALLAYHADLAAHLASFDPGPPPTDIAAELAEILQKRATVQPGSPLEVAIKDQANGHDLFKVFGPAGVQVVADLPSLWLTQDSLALRPTRIVLMHYKSLYRFPRPEQLEPGLKTVVPTPGHASYPSGHGCQHRLSALLIDHILSPVERALSGDQAYDTWRALLFQRGDEVGVNREYAGVHYHSDTKAGWRIAEAMFPVLSRHFGALYDRMRSKWEVWRKTHPLPMPPP